jgi:hypothetical protein
MKLTKQEIQDELTHKNVLIRTYRARIRPLEIQAAQKGLNAPPEILTEISTISELIRVQEDEISKLESLAAEGQLSLVEAEYRVIIADAWDTPSGRPSAIGTAQIELARLRFGLSSERAQELENDMRVALVKDVFEKIDISPLIGQNLWVSPDVGTINFSIKAEGESEISIDRIEIDQNLTISSPLESVLHLLGKAIRLDPPTALHLLLQSLPQESKLDIIILQEKLIMENKAWISKNEFEIFNHFLADLASQLNTHLSSLPEKTQDEGD